MKTLGRTSLIILSLLLSYSFSKGQGLKISVDIDSKIDTFRYSENFKKYITAVIENINLENIKIPNIPGYNIYFKVEKKVNNVFVNLMDSSCYTIVDPILPAEGFQMVDFKKGQKISQKIEYPPLCSFLQTGDYRVKCVFWYELNKKNKNLLSDWYYFYIASKM